MKKFNQLCVLASTDNKLWQDYRNCFDTWWYLENRNSQEFFLQLFSNDQKKAAAVLCNFTDILLNMFL